MHRYWFWELFKVMEVKPQVLVLKTKLYGLTKLYGISLFTITALLRTFEVEPAGHYVSKWQIVIT